MDTKAARLLLVTSMTAVMVAMVTLVTTLVNIGYVPDFFARWFKAYIVSWPIAATTGFLVMPTARRFTARVMTLLGSAA